MRARLTPRQIQMLIDGKELTSGRKKFRLPFTAASLDIRNTLKQCLENGDTVYLDVDKTELYYETTRPV